MNKLWQKTLSLVLAFVMVVGMLPMNAIAAEAEDAPVVTEVTTEAPTETPTETPTEAPAETPTEVPTETPTEAPTETLTEAPTETPAEAPAETPTEPEETEAPTEPEEDEAVIAVQAMIDALVIPNTDNYASAERYEAALAQVEAQLRAIDAAAAELTEEQLGQIDATNAESVVQAMNNYWLAQIPMMIVEGSGTEADPYIYTVGEGETVNGAQLYVWIGTNTLWSTSRHYYAGDTQFTTGGTMGTTVSGDTSKTFGAGTYAIYGTTVKYVVQHNKDSSPKGYITIREVKADEADMTMKESPYTVAVNLDTYTDLTAQKIIDAAVATNKETVTVNFRDYDDATWGGHDNWTELTSTNLSTFLASEDKTSFQLICGNTTKEITVSFTESRSPWSVSYTGEAISYTGDDALLAAVKAGLSVTGVGTPPAAEVTFDNTTLPAAGQTGNVTFNVSVAQDAAKENLAYSGTVTVSVTMPAQQYTVTLSVNDSTLGTAALSHATAVEGTTVTVTAAPADADGSDGSATYVKSITVNGTAIEGTTFTVGQADAEVVVTFATRSITAQPVTVYMNSNNGTLGISHDEYKDHMVISAMNYTATGEGSRDGIYLEMQYSTLVGQNWAQIGNLGISATTACDLPSATKDVSKTIRLVWPAEGNLPEIISTAVTVTIKDSYRTITYMNGDSTLSTAGTERLATTATAAAPTKEGHTFQGWNTAADGSGTSYAADAEITMGEDNVTLYAQWAANTYTVTWVDGNGNTLKTDSVEYGTVPTYNGAAPTKNQTDSTVYTWNNGWDKEVVAVTGDTTYTATFTESAREYAISWDTNGDSTVDTTTQVAYGTVPTAPAHADRSSEDLSPNGWSPEIVAVSGEATYTAQYSNDTVYTVKFVVDGQDYSVQYVNVTKGQSVTTPTAPDKEYAVFGGWDAEIVTTPTADATYTATWLADENNNNVVDTDETGTVQVNITGNGTVSLSGGSQITENSNGGYTVLYDSAAENGNVITVTATPNDTVNTDGSVDYLISAPETVTVVNGQTVTVSAEFGTESITVAESGTVYVNGYLDSKLDGLKNKVLTAAGIDTTNAGDYTVFVRVGKITGGTEDIDVETTNWLEQQNINARMQIGDTQTFIIRKNGTNVVSDTIAVTIAESRLSLSITASEESISFEGKTEVEGIKESVKGLFTIETTDPQTNEQTSVQVSDSYITWSPAYVWPEDGETKTFTVTCRVNTLVNSTYQNAPSASVTVTLTDTTVFYTVTYLDGYNTENNVVATYTVAENLAMQTPDVPAREYYTFAGWDPTVAETVTENVTYTATWTANTDANGNSIADETETYTVKYVLGNGEADAVTENLAWGDATPTAPTPTREGYNFNGWDVSPAAIVSAPASGNTITYTAQWTQNHAVIFMSNGTQYDTAEVENGQTLVKPADPSRGENYDFLYWYEDGKEETEYTFTEPVTSNLTLTAKWRTDFNHNDIEDATEAHYTVIYDVDGAQTTHEKVLTGMPMPAMANPVKDGYLFGGWAVNGEIVETIPETVTADVTYVAQWLNDSNSNGVDDTLETVTFAITGSGKVTIGLTEYTDGDTYVYDSTGSKTITVKAAPVTALSGLKYVSSSYVTGISVDETAADLTYAENYSVTHSFTANGSHTVSVAFADIAFAYNEERVLKFYPGMPDVKNEDVYNAVVDTPDLPGAYTIQYKAREATSAPVTLTGLGLGSTVDALLDAAGLGTFNIDLPALWLDVNVETGEMVKDSVSLDQAVKQYLTADSVKAAWEENGINGIRALLTEVTDAATYYGAHNFGYNATEAETVTEEIRITYGQDAYYIEGATTVDLRDTRLPSYVKGSNVSVMYKDYTDEDIWTLTAPYAANGEGTQISEDITCLDITDPYTYEGYGAAEYELTFKFAGNDDYKPSETTFTVTVTKAPASIDIPNTTVNYGDSYTMLDESFVTVGNKYGDKSEVTKSMIQFIIGLDVADVDVNADGVSGLNGQVQLILPADLQSMLDGIIEAAGGDLANGADMTLSELVKYLEPIQDTSLEALKQALSAITQITETGDITVQLGGALPTDTGAYLYGAVSTSSNYETAFDVAYIVIKPNTTQVYLDWNYTDTNGVFTYELMQAVDMGASAYDEAAFTTRNDAASELIQNLIFGVDVNGELVTALVPQGGTLEASELATGAYTQLAFVAEFGNEFYYAVPIVRAFVIVPNAVDVEIGNETDSNQAVFDGTAHSLDVAVSYDGSAFEVSDEFLTVQYSGIQTNTKTYSSTEAPVHAGAYAVSAIYIQRDESGEIIAMGADIEPLIIKPADSSISVTGGTFEYDGEAHGVTVESTHADVTIISGTVDFDGDITGLGIEDVTGVLNVDVPAWLDDYLAENHPHAYTNGLTKADFTRKLDEYREKLTEYGMSEETIDSLIQLLNDIPADVQIKFNDVNTYAEPGVYAYVGVVTDSDYVPSYDTGLVVIQKKDLLLDMKDTTVTYDGEGHFVEVVCEPVTDYLTIIVDRENNIGNIILEDDMMALLNIVEDSLGREMPESVTLLELKTAVEDALTKLAGIEQLPIDVAMVLDEIIAALNRLPDTSTVYINGELPVDVGEYEFYGASISAEYATQLTEGVLTIDKRDVTVTLDDQSKVYGESDPELTYEVEGLVDGDDLNIVVSRAEGEDVGDYTITATAENANYNIAVVDGELTITAKTITEADVALNGSLTYNGVMQIQYITITDGITYEITGNRASNAGNYTLIVTGTGNYTGSVELDWSIAKATAEITLDSTPITVTYGETVVLPTATSNFGDVTCDKIPADLVEAGTYTVTYTVAATDNYNGAIKAVTVTISKAESSIDKAPVAVEDLVYNGEEQALVTPGTAIGGTMEYSLDGETWGAEIPTATDAGEYTVYYRVKGDANHNDVAGGSVKVTIAEKSTGKTIQFPIGGAVQPGGVVEINGINYVVDADLKIKVDQAMTGDLIVTSYSINANAGAGTPEGDEYADEHKAYPQHMYVWYAEYDAANDCYLLATEITELRDFFTYAGTSIRYSSNANDKHGIRIITSVDEATRTTLINGDLIENDALAGWKLVEYGTVFKNNTKVALAEGTNLVYTGQSTGNASVAYGNYNGSHLDQIFNRAGGNIQFTGMLVELADDLLDDELIMRPYMVLESPDGERITIHGGSLQRNIGYVAWQNRNFDGGTGAKAFIQNIIKKVYG